MLSLSGQAERHKIQALENINANIMIADVNLNITYMNPAVKALMQEAEAELKKELPRFNSASLIGSNIDIFHKNPAHQRHMLAAMTAPHNATIWVGSRAFDLHVSPLRKGSRITGYVVEWSNANDRLQNLDYKNQMEAISRAQAIVELKPDGTVVNANDNFLNALGYRLEDVKGKHHRIFVDQEMAGSQTYAEFWDNLSNGRFQAGEFTRIGRNGKIVVINASYNPILDSQGKLAKIVKFATVVTDRVNAVTEIGNGLKRLAAGDLSFQLDAAFAPDFESLRHDLNDAVRQLGETLTDVSTSTGEIDTGTREISRSANDLSKRTEQQAASLEETAAALDEITANVTNSSMRAEEARLAAANASSSANQSGKVVADAVSAMARIENSSNQISNIIGVIDEIAFQTNLLALNAGVEAARAGDAGKGFAVVAQEVRELAQRSAQAAKEIKDLIRNSSEEVKTGVRLVSETGEALKTIATNIVAVNDRMESIANAAKEQSTGLAEVNKAVNQMDQVTQQNAAMVEETNAASATLAQETDKLRRLLGRFQVAASRATMSQSPAARRPVEAQPSRSAPQPSPARQLVKKVASATGASTAAAADSWEEF